MTERQNIDVKIYAYILVPVLILFFYLSAPFNYDEVTIFNYTELLQKGLFSHYFNPVWVYNEQTIPCMGVGLILWVMVCAYLSYSLRNFQHGKAYGDDDWADPFEVTSRRADLEDPSNNRTLSRDCQIRRHGEGAPSNNNMLVIGTSGGYKTTSIVAPNLLKAKNNLVVLDVKGELMYKYGLYLQKHGYDISALNMKDQLLSDRYNPFAYIENETDLLKLVTCIQEACTPPDAITQDPIWKDGPAMYLGSIFYYVWDTARRKGEVGNMTSVLLLLNEEMIMTNPNAKPNDPDYKRTKLHDRMDKAAEIYGNDYPAVRDYRKLKEGATETVRSIVIILNSMLHRTETAEMHRIFEKDELNIRDFAYGVGGTKEHPTNKKKALFLIADDEDTTFNFVFAMLYQQILDILCRIADTDFKQNGGELPIPLEMWMDEFYAGARPPDVERIMGVIRSRNISMIPILQSKAQVEAIFKDGKANIINDNTPVMVFLGAGRQALDTHKWISELLGSMTVDTVTDSRQGVMTGNTEQFGQKDLALMSPTQVGRMSTKECIIFIQEERPIHDRKALPWEDDEDSPYFEAMRLNKKSPDGGYIHPVHVVAIEQEKKQTYLHTLRYDKNKKGMIDRSVHIDVDEGGEIVQTFADADKPKVYHSIKEFENMNLRSEKNQKKEEFSKIAKDVADTNAQFGIIEDIDMGGSFYDVILRYHNRLDAQTALDVLTRWRQGEDESVLREIIIQALAAA